MDKQSKNNDIPNFSWIGTIGFLVISAIFYLCYLLSQYMEG